MTNSCLATDLEPGAEIIKQLDVRSVTHEQLLAEADGIYAGLNMVENKCMGVETTLGIDSLNGEQWQALVALYRTLLNEHHDFFLATQHPSGSSALKKLAKTYNMPARMWRHAIQAFLDIMYKRLNQSQVFMEHFIFLAYNMLSLLDETVPSFLNAWIECKADLARYG